MKHFAGVLSKIAKLLKLDTIKIDLEPRELTQTLARASFPKEAGSQG